MLKHFLKTINRGWGRHGQLGHTNRKNQIIPKEVEALADEAIVDVACGEYQTCAITSTGSIFTWGRGIASGHVEDVVVKPKLLQDLSSKGVVSVSANDAHTACVTKAGEVFTWGSGMYGKLGHGDERNKKTPKRVEALVGVNAKEVSCGGSHTAVCTEGGHVYTFGNGKYGQLGHGDKENMSSPALVVQALDGKDIIQVQCGCTHTMALTSSGYVFTWGSVDYGVLGHGNVKPKSLSIPCLVEGLREHNIIQISSGYCHCGVLVEPSSPSIIRQSQQASFNNNQHSDVVLMVENQPLYANVDVLTQKSDYFAAMFRSNMRESIERVVQVPNCSKASFLLILEYLCLDGFIVSIDDVVELWGLADMYQMEGLKYCCMGALERGLSAENASEILEEVEELSCPCDELKRVCHENLNVQNLLLKRNRRLKRKKGRLESIASLNSSRRRTNP
jgi:alpha-tubulin suppressor-like RCC1 family protein